jgi:hypothetical protein
MNDHPLLGPFKRQTKYIPLSSRPDLKVFLLAITAGEGMRHAKRIAPLEGDAAVYALLSEHICDEEGNRLLTDEQAEKFVDVISTEDLKSLMSEVILMSGVNDKALENTEKN